jgi:hypothetical protein
MEDTQRSERCGRKPVEVRLLSQALCERGEMVDTLARGASGREAVEVRLLSFTPRCVSSDKPEGQVLSDARRCGDCRASLGSARQLKQQDGQMPDHRPLCPYKKLAYKVGSLPHRFPPQW